MEIDETTLDKWISEEMSGAESAPGEENALPDIDESTLSSWIEDEKVGYLGQLAGTARMAGRDAVAGNAGSTETGRARDASRANRRVGQHQVDLGKLRGREARPRTYQPHGAYQRRQRAVRIRTLRLAGK
jgi:hypothetical protein